MLSYTLCIIQRENKLAMLYRKKNPNKGKWNFVGGKIEVGETIKDAAKREAEEETNLTLQAIEFRGIVKWNDKDGMYVYYSNSFKGNLDSSEEGMVEWKDLDWIRNSNEVVSNIHHFLPHVLDLQSKPKLHNFYYDENDNFVHQTMTEIKEKVNLLS